MAEHSSSWDLLSKMLYIDTKSWLPDDLLVKADKMTMANSVELRVPLLDHEILEFAAGLPASFKLHGVTTKYILKTAFRKFVPNEILDRKKTGFLVPYASWMRKELRPLVEDVLLSKRALDRGYFTRQGIEGLLAANLNGEGDYSKEIFSLLVLELWHREFIDGDSGATVSDN
jgi:asparagine synthase (glutamine-hydrolysing)